MFLVGVVDDYFGIANLDEQLVRKIQETVFSAICEVVGDSNRKLKTNERNMVVKKSIERIKETVEKAKNYTKPVPIIETQKVISDSNTTHVETVCLLTHN